MQRTFVMIAPVQYSIGLPDVLVPVQQMLPMRGASAEGIKLTQDMLATESNWGDDDVIAETEAALEARHPGDTVELLTLPEWQAREVAAAQTPEPEGVLSDDVRDLVEGRRAPAADPDAPLDE